MEKTYLSPLVPLGYRQSLWSSEIFQVIKHMFAFVLRVNFPKIKGAERIQQQNWRDGKKKRVRRDTETQNERGKTQAGEDAE